MTRFTMKLTLKRETEYYTTEINIDTNTIKRVVDENTIS